MHLNPLFHATSADVAAHEEVFASLQDDPVAWKAALDQLGRRPRTTGEDELYRDEFEFYLYRFDPYA